MPAKRKPKPPTGRPPGRPSVIDQVIDQRRITDPDTGNVVRTEDVTVAERIIETVRAGGYVEIAAARTGIHKDTVYEWLKVGAQTKAALIANPDVDVTAHALRCVEFSDAVTRAQADSETESLGRIALAARGGLVKTIVSEKVAIAANGTSQVVERVTRTETTLPDTDAERWRVERRFRSRWGPGVQVEMSGPAGAAIPIEHRIDALAEKVAAFKAGLEDVSDRHDEPRFSEPTD